MSMAQGSPERRRFSSATRGILAAAALLLPSLSLLPLGGLYLWEHGWLLWWALAALACVALTTGALKWLLRAPSRVEPVPSTLLEAGADPHWSDEEIRAWKDVLHIAARVDADQITSTGYFVDLGQATLNAVARRLHPEKSDALWQFTLPEALAIVERVSRRLGTFVVDSVPFGDRLTVAQVLAAYRWRGAFDVAERAYDVWRILRIVNPATAVTNEARERLSRAVYNYGKEHVSRRIAEAFVEEVGRAAIDLYGGRLMVAQKLAQEAAARAPDPLSELSSREVSLSLAIAGGSRSDRLAIASMLGEACRRRKVSADQAPDNVATTLGEPFAIRAGSHDEAGVVEELASADVIVWLLDNAAVAADAKALALLSARLRAADAGAPVLIPVVLHELHEAADEANAPLAAAARSLSEALDTPLVRPIAISSLDVAPPGVLDPLLDEVIARTAQARRVHIVRTLKSARRGASWTQSARQAFKAAGALTKAVARRRRD